MVTVRQLMSSRGWALWCVLAGLMCVESVLVDSGVLSWVLVIVSILFVGVAFATMQSHPLVALAIVLAMMFAELTRAAQAETGTKLSYIGALVVICYLSGRGMQRVRGFVILLSLALAAQFVAAVVTRDVATTSAAIFVWLSFILASVLFVLLPWLYGRYRAQHDRFVAAGWARAEQTETTQQMAVEQARLRERNRIARDMHDVVGHELSLIALRAGALELDPELSEQHRSAAGELRTAAASATDRLRQVIGVLRVDDTAVETEPAVESVDAIIERAQASGLEVSVATEGTAGSLKALVAQAIARAVQEALTNASRHAPGAPVDVHVVYGADMVEVRVRNELRPDPSQDAAPGTGLTGLDERLRVLGGTLSYGSHDAEFELSAQLPRDAEVKGGDIAQPTVAQVHAVERQRAARGLRVAIGAPLVFGAVMTVLLVAYYVVLGYLSVLDEQDYDRLSVGQSRERAEDLLPVFEMVDPPSPSSSPEDAECRMYASAGPFQSTFAYRVCFDDDVLVLKDRVQTGSSPIEEDS